MDSVHQVFFILFLGDLFLFLRFQSGIGGLYLLVGWNDHLLLPLSWNFGIW